jgi:putative membrane protein
LLAEAHAMIKRYSDHAANERTFLAWVRTAIAVMAFGFLIERFDLFLKYMSAETTHRPIGSHSEAFANWAGLAFILLGIAMIAIAGLRFARTAKDIDTEEAVASPGERFDLALALMVALLGAALLLYMANAVLPSL